MLHYYITTYIYCITNVVDYVLPVCLSVSFSYGYLSIFVVNKRIY